MRGPTAGQTAARSPGRARQTPRPDLTQQGRAKHHPGKQLADDTRHTGAPSGVATGSGEEEHHQDLTPQNQQRMLVQRGQRGDRNQMHIQD